MDMKHAHTGQIAPSICHLLRREDCDNWKTIPNRMVIALFYFRNTESCKSNSTEDGNLLAELSFITLTIHLCDGLNDNNLVKPKKTLFSYCLTISCVTK